MPKGSEKHVKFAPAWVETGCNVEAYKRAGYSWQNMRRATLKQEAYEVRHHPVVSLTIEKLQERAAVTHDLSRERLINMLLADRVTAREMARPAAAISACLAVARIAGLLAKKRTDATKASFEHFTDEELERIIAEKKAVAKS